MSKEQKKVVNYPVSTEEQGWRSGKSANHRRKLKSELYRQEALRTYYERECHENSELIKGLVQWHTKRWDKHPNFEDMDLKEQMFWFTKEISKYDQVIKHLVIRAKEITSEYEILRTKLNTPDPKES